ncbi:glycosyl hydrolase 53 family protein [Weizmannia sp. FSL W8-0401]|uniref:glycosyl hydrolase 53 family protein n=1 Tax=Weizmannia sp. FSL W8-0401 TaxID=2954554 RepID=UPI0030F749CC
MKKVTRSLLVAGSTLALLAGSFAPSLAVPFALADTPSDTAAAYSNGTDTGASKLPALISKVSTVTDDTIRGIDLTPYQAELAAGVKYKDFNGRSLDEEGFMNLLKDSGVNYVNLKVAVNPANDEGKSYDGGNPTLENAVKTAQAAKSAGLKVNINFLFSDFYTSKNNQKLPKGWATDNLKDTAVRYISESLNKLKSNNVTPDMVTVGSNLAQNFLSQDMATGNDILAAVTKEIRSFDSSIQIALAYADPGSNWFTTIANNLKSANVDYDILGANVYAAWDAISDIKGAMEAAKQAGKKFAVLSVSYPFTDQDSDGESNGSTASDILKNGIGEVSPQGQATYLHNLYSAITADGNNTAGCGAFYDNAVWIAVEAGNSGTHWQHNKDAAEKYGTGWATTAAAGYVDGADQWAGASSVDNQALFDDLGNPLQSLTAFKQLLTGTDDGSSDNTSGNTGTTAPAPQADPFETGADTGLKAQTVTINKLTNMTSDSIRGVDISSYEALKEAGVKYYDFSGNRESLLKILHDNGVNYIRLRIWNDPKSSTGAIYGGGQCDVEHELAIAKEAAQYGMKILLDFHYSDFWADPAQQILPKAWRGHSDAQLQKDVYSFTSGTIKKFQNAGADVGMVQVGNEITNGMMGVTTNRDAGESYTGIWNNKTKSARVDSYIKSGIKAVRDTAPNALVTLHIETPDVKKYTDIMNAWKRDGVDYDVLGSSYYPYWSVAAKANTPETLTKVEKLAASYGKLFAVMETAWVNSLKDADGTPNSIGEEQSNWQNTNAFPVGPQGQVDALTSLYSTVMSQQNGLGAFYWEPAWIPVYAGWDNWKANKDAAEKYGTGWASSGAVGYFPDSKMYYNGKPAWGGTTWDNQGLFDDRGYALQSLKFYRDAVNDVSRQTTVIKYVDAKTGEPITPNTIVRTTVGNTAKVSLPKVNHYTPSSKSYSYSLKANTAGVKMVTVKYDLTSKQGNAINYGKYVTVTNSKYAVYQNFNWKKKNVKAANKTYLAKYAYHHTNGSTYLSLYDAKGKWAGYINAHAVKTGQGKQGAGIPYSKYVTVTNSKYAVYQNFNWKKKNVKVANKTYLAKYAYHHTNGSTYLSLYDAKGKWAGYINAHAVKTGQGKQGAGIPYSKYVTVTNGKYAVYQNFNWKKKNVKAANKTYLAKYAYYHSNGLTYLSLYDGKGKWVGYINAKAVKAK